MKISGLRSSALAALAILCGSIFLPPLAPLAHSQDAAAPASEIVLTVDPAQSTVHWTVDSTIHTVHGTFALKTGTVRFDPQTGNAAGEVVVLAPTGVSGNGSRDKRMHKEILETAKYPEVVFRPTRVEGKVAEQGTSDIKLAGVFSIHGTDHDLTALVHATLTTDHWHGTCTFQVPYVKWGIKDPSNFLLRVKPVVNVELELAGEVNPAK
jgi:polyisoprenoid-binding protein YceI